MLIIEMSANHDFLLLITHSLALSTSVMLMHLPKTKSRVANSQLSESATRLSLLLVERRTRGFASPPLDGFAFSLAIPIAAATP